MHCIVPSESVLTSNEKLTEIDMNDKYEVWSKQTKSSQTHFYHLLYYIVGISTFNSILYFEKDWKMKTHQGDLERLMDSEEDDNDYDDASWSVNVW